MKPPCSKARGQRVASGPALMPASAAAPDRRAGVHGLGEGRWGHFSTRFVLHTWSGHRSRPPQALFWESEWDGMDQEPLHGEDAQRTTQISSVLSRLPFPPLLVWVNLNIIHVQRGQGKSFVPSGSAPEHACPKTRAGGGTSAFMELRGEI